MLLSDLKDMVVYSKDMTKLGKVKDFEIDSEQLTITHLVVELEDQATLEFFGKKPRIRHTKGKSSIELIVSVKDAIILKEEFKDLKGMIEKL